MRTLYASATRRSLVAASAGLAAFLILAGVAYAFPKVSTVSPSYSGCSTSLQAVAGLAGGDEKLYTAHTDWAGCADTVETTAKILITGVGIISAGPDTDDYKAEETITAPDFYYGYGWGRLRVGSWSSYTSTLSVHP
jgi:hypothetical protein